MADGSAKGADGVSRKEREEPLETLLDEAIAEADGEKMRIQDLFAAYGTRSFGPLIAILGLIAASPIGAIPGLPAALGVLISLMSVQLLAGRKDPWVPDRIKHLGVKRKKAEDFRENYDKWLSRIDNFISPRLEWAAGPTAQWLAAFFCIGLSVLMVPLEAIPFAVSVPAAAIMMFGLGLTSRDGLLMLLGFAITAASIYLTFTWLGGGSEPGADGSESEALGLMAPFTFGTLALL